MIPTVRITAAVHLTLFYTMLPNSSEKIGMFVNVEAQSVHKLKYPLMKRSRYYGSRMISAQFQRDFADGDYKTEKSIFHLDMCQCAG